MRLHRDIKIDGEIRGVATELTVDEIKAWLDGVTAGGNLIDLQLFEEVSLPDLTKMTSLTADDLGKMAPSEIKVVIAAAKEANADFFDFRARTVKLGIRIQELITAESKT